MKRYKTQDSAHFYYKQLSLYKITVVVKFSENFKFKPIHEIFMFIVESEAALLS